MFYTFYLLVIFSRVQLSRASTMTHAPELHPRQSVPTTGSSACEGYTSFVAECAASTPGFLSLGPGEQYSCLCFNQSTWAPSIYQGYIAGCLSYLKTASTAYYSSIGGADLPTDPCTSISDLLATAVSTPTSAAASPTLTAPAASYSAACVSLQGLIASCASETPSFTDLSFSSQASCLCGASSSTYFYDQVWQSCLSYEEIVAPSFWSHLGGTVALTTPCAAAAGDLGSATALLTSSATPASANPTASSASMSASMSASTLSSPSASSVITSATPNSAQDTFSGFTSILLLTCTVGLILWHVR